MAMLRTTAHVMRYCFTQPLSVPAHLIVPCIKLRCMIIILYVVLAKNLQLGTNVTWFQ